MNRRLHATTLIVAAAILALGFDAKAADPKAEPPTIKLTPKRPPTALSVPTIDFGEFYRFGARGPALTEKLLALQGQRVTVVGFMVLLETPVRGGFYLAPYPAMSDESGAGRGGVPPTSLLVLPTIAKGKQVAFVPGALEITGVLDVGNTVLDGESSTIRLLVQNTAEFKFARMRSPARASGNVTAKRRISP